MGRWLLGTAVMLLALGSFGVSAASAATLNVCASGCTYSSIPEAINNAKSGDTINIAAGTYDEHLAIPGSGGAASLSLQGAGAGKTTIDGTESGTVVAISSHETVTITGVTVTHGAESAIQNRGTLTLNNSTVSENAAFQGGGIDNEGGTLKVNNSTVSTNGANEGAGIYNGGGTVKVNNSTLSDNAATLGGGIYNAGGAVTVNHSTLTKNSATASHHGGTEGGGIYNASGGTVVLRNSTISDNKSSEGGGILNEGTVSGTHDTILGNKVNGIQNANGGTVNLRHSKVQEP
jgi:hypothetical protein